MNLKDGKTTREFWLSTLAINNRTTVFVLTVLIVFAGIAAYISMPKASYPDIVIPQIYIGTPYPGNSPVDIEKLITRPFEKEINAISDVNKITSTSTQGYSTIIAEFDFSIDPTEGLRKIKDAVDKAMSEPGFPDDLPSEPSIFEMDFSEFPIMNINLSGDFSMEQLRKYAEYLEEEIEELSEISKVDLRGVQEKEVRISVDMHKMEALQISFNDIEKAIQSENVTISGGDLLTDGLRRTLKVAGDFTSIDQIGDVIVKQEKFNIVYLKEIADISFEFEERKSYAREFKKPVVMVDVVKRAGENMIRASEKINEIILYAKTNVFPKDLEISITNDQSEKTREMVSNLENSIVSGIILVVLVLLFFLGFRNALFVGIAIPLSMFTSFMILSVLGVTINMMVLFALILALGMLVDNGIVVVENIYRLMEEGMPPIQAAKEGVGEVALPIITSTATTLAAFLPLAFWPGMMGEFMQYLPITLIIVLGSSLFVALVINPVLTSVFMRVGNYQPNRKKIIRTSLVLIAGGLIAFSVKFISFGSLLMAFALITLLNFFVLGPAAKVFQSGFMPVFENSYQRFLRFALSGKKPLAFIFGTIGLLFFSFVLLVVFTPKILFFPTNMPKYVNIFIEMPIGTDIKATNEVVLQVEDLVIEEMKKYEINVNGKKSNFLVESIIANVGQGASDPKEGAAMANTPHKARITVSFVEYQDRQGVETGKVMEDIRKAVKQQFPGVKISVGKDNMGPPVGPPINIEVIGKDIDVLLEQAGQIRDYINRKNIAGIDELKLDVKLGKPELIIDIDRRKARRLNLSTGQIATAIRTALYGKEISKYKEGEDDYPIQLRFDEKYRYDAEALLNQRITFRDQTTGKIKQVPISAVATAHKSSTYSSVKRKNLDRVITVFSNVIEGYNPTEIVNKIREVMKDYPLPEDIETRFTGEQEEQAKEMAFLSKALMVAVFLIFLIIVSQFNSAGIPFIIVGSVVLSLIGVLLGLVIFQMDFVIIMTMVGIISLAGIVVNNAIVLLDYTNLVMQRRHEELGLAENERLPINEVMNCIIQGGKVRLRPVLLTAITTVLGLLPMATGMNINYFTLLSEFDPQIFFGGDNVTFWGPMSWTVIFGLSFATFLTLVIVPVMYFMMNKLKYKIQPHPVSSR